MKTFSILALVAGVGLLLSACADDYGWHHHDGGYHDGGGYHDHDHHDRDHDHDNH